MTEAPSSGTPCLANARGVSSHVSLNGPIVRICVEVCGELVWIEPEEFRPMPSERVPCFNED